MKAYPVTVLCRVMRVGRSHFYHYLKCRKAGNTDPGQAQLERRIKDIFKASKKTYGSRRMLVPLREEGYTIGRYRVRRLMRKLNLKARTPKRFKATTDSNHDHPVAKNLLDRQFDVTQPDTVYTTDITYIWTLEGWLYLAVVMDLFSRQIVGWALDKRMKSQLVMDALKMAYWRRKPAAGLLHHSDRGSQYAGTKYQKLLKSYKMICSMSRKGNCWDNAPMERFFRSLKSEHLSYCRLISRAVARAEVLDYITFYNAYRRHSTLGYLSPMEFERYNALKAA